jgi:hypothetical protein
MSDGFEVDVGRVPQDLSAAARLAFCIAAVYRIWCQCEFAFNVH